MNIERLLNAVRLRQYIRKREMSGGMLVFFRLDGKTYSVLPSRIDTKLDIPPENRKIKVLESSNEDGGRNSGNHNHGGRPGKVGGSTPKPSARGANQRCTGFATEKLLRDHIKRHLREYPGFDEAMYVEHAKDFLSQPCSEDVDGYVTKQGEVVRFNRKTGEYAKGVPNGRIVTCFIARYNQVTGKSNLVAANRYFDREKETEGVTEDA